MICPVCGDKVEAWATKSPNGGDFLHVEFCCTSLHCNFDKDVIMRVVEPLPLDELEALENERHLRSMS